MRSRSVRPLLAALALAAWGCGAEPAPVGPETLLRSTAASGTVAGGAAEGEASSARAATGSGRSDPTTGNPLDPGAGAPFRDEPTSSTSGSTGATDDNARPSRTGSTGGGAGPHGRSAAVPA